MSDIQSAMLADITFKRDRLLALNAELLAALEDDWHVMAIIEPKRED